MYIFTLQIKCLPFFCIKSAFQVAEKEIIGCVADPPERTQGKMGNKSHEGNIPGISGGGGGGESSCGGGHEEHYKLKQKL